VLETELNGMFEFEHNLQQKIAESESRKKFDNKQISNNENKATEIIESIKHGNIASFSRDQIEQILNYLNSNINQQQNFEFENRLSSNIPMNSQLKGNKVNKIQSPHKLRIRDCH